MTIDNRAAARRGALAFTGAKHPAVVSQPLFRERISSISGGADITEVMFPVTRNRLEGYRQAAEGAGIAWRDVTIAVCARNDAAEGERHAATLLASATPPDAIAAMSDQQAAGVVRAIRAADLAVPDDVAVTGWDDGAVAAQLEITTVAQPLRHKAPLEPAPRLDSSRALRPRRGPLPADEAHAHDQSTNCRPVPDRSHVVFAPTGDPRGVDHVVQTA